MSRRCRARWPKLSADRERWVTSSEQKGGGTSEVGGCRFPRGKTGRPGGPRAFCVDGGGMTRSSQRREHYSLTALLTSCHQYLDRRAGDFPPALAHPRPGSVTPTPPGHMATAAFFMRAAVFDTPLISLRVLAGGLAGASLLEGRVSIRAHGSVCAARSQSVMTLCSRLARLQGRREPQ